MKNYITISMLLLFTLLISACNNNVNQEITNIDEEENIIIAESFIDLLVEGDFEEATFYFDEKKATELPPEQLEVVWLGAVQQFGDFTSKEYEGSEIYEGNQVVYFTGQFESEELQFIISFDEHNNIVDFYMV
ncbi:DUF3887 domain-containing protein [Evansella sp. AB-P1]|uniref:DUF3887 domain-containing protein n=1 Tax=Evansella sp. AB-P1 TaxID=3037653 RepID=UPI00241CE30F|nr:DUF3887 domain-containing protein [Evansella sp. AB-P1]MDG5790078.1 DUF3887 domain-containing protein [Evansella sp. AB-P1]